MCYENCLEARPYRLKCAHEGTRYVELKKLEYIEGVEGRRKNEMV